jgi:hypothetical protein
MSSGTIGLLIGGQSEKLTASGSLADTVDKCVFNKPVANQLMTETHTFHVLSLPKNPSQVADKWLFHTKNEQRRCFSERQPGFLQSVVNKPVCVGRTRFIQTTRG